MTSAFHSSGKCESILVPAGPVWGQAAVPTSVRAATHLTVLHFPPADQGRGSREVALAEPAWPRGVTYDGHDPGGQGGAGPCRGAGTPGEEASSWAVPAGSQAATGEERTSPARTVTCHLVPMLTAAWPAPVYPAGPPLTREPSVCLFRVLSAVRRQACFLWVNTLGFQRGVESTSRAPSPGRQLSSLVVPPELRVMLRFHRRERLGTVAQERRALSRMGMGEKSGHRRRARPRGGVPGHPRNRAGVMWTQGEGQEVSFQVRLRASGLKPQV